MKSKMNTYKGAAFYVDILGFTALTKGQVANLKPSDFRAWGLWRKADKNHSFLAATILLEFRDVLFSAKSKYPEIHISHMSDCAFLWSNNIMKLLQAVHYVMWKLTASKGILCRGGIAYGEIVEVLNVDNSLGEFLMGDAATRAAHNESLLKGPRIAMDNDFPEALWSNGLSSAFIQYYSNDLFHPNHNDIDLSTVDEYRWYLCDDDDLQVTRTLTTSERIELMKKRLQLGNYLRFHPRMGWNCRDQKGQLQIAAGVKSLTASGLLGISHQFTTEIPIIDNRTVANFNAANKRIDQGHYTC